MKVPAEFRPLLDAGDRDGLEDAWLRRLSSHPTDVETFAAVARALAAGEDGDPEHASFLLQLVDEQLQNREHRHVRLDLLRRAGDLLLGEGGDVHGEIVATLDELYGEHEIYQEMAANLGLHRATHDLPKTWEKVARLHELMAYDVGTIVAMEGRGVGRVVEANFQLEKLKVEFHQHGDLMLGFRAAAKMLEPLPPHHVLRRKVEDPEGLKALAEEDPPALLRLVLESREGNRTAAEVRKDLAGVLPDDRWTAFWNAARKHPQVVVHGKGRQSYSWAHSEDHALEAVWDAFEDAAPRKRIDLLRREGERDAELAGRMAAELTETARGAADDDPGLAFELFVALERAGHATADDDEPFTPAALLGGGHQATLALLAGIDDRGARERAYREVRRLRDEWRQVYLDRLGSEEDHRALDLLMDELEAAGEETGEGLPKELGRFFDGLLAQPHRSPAAFVWMAERAADDVALLTRNPLRLLQQILTAVGRDEFSTYRQRLKNLLGKGGTARRVFPELAVEQAPDAARALYRAGYLEGYEREDLERALQLQFPSLKGDSAASADVLWATPESIEAKEARLDEITRRELPANRVAIEEARAMGDLRENFEYKSARQRHEYLTALATEISAELQKAKPIRHDAIDPSQVRLGTRVLLTSDGGDERVLTVLGPWESDPDNGVISYESELAQKLLGKGVGETVDTGETVAKIEVAEF